MPISDEDLGMGKQTGITDADLGITSSSTQNIGVTESTDDKLSPIDNTNNLEKMKSSANAFLMSFYSIGSTLAKAVTKPFSKRGAEAIQNFYEQKEMKFNEDLQNDPSLMAPYLAGAFAMPLGPIGLVGKGAAMGAKAMSSLPMAGKMVGGATGGAVEGAAYGSLFNQTGQGTDILNPEMAKVGATFGGALGSLQGGIGAYASKVGQLSRAKEEISKAGDWKGPIFIRDLQDDWRQKLGNQVLDNLPLGTGKYRDQQVDQLKPFLTDWIDNLSTIKTPQAMGAAIKKSRNDIATLEKETWDDFISIMGDTPVLSSSSKNTMKSILQDASVPKFIKQDLVEYMNKNSAISTRELKTKIWGFKSNLEQRANVDEDAVRNMYNLYTSLRNDLQTAATSKSEDALMKFNNANMITQSEHEIFNPKTQGALVNALKDMDGNMQGLQSFVKWLTVPSSAKTAGTERTSKQIIGLLGEDVTRGMASAGLKQAFDASIDVGTNKFNVTQFLTKLKDIKNNEATKMLYQPHLEALQGLEKYVMNPQVVTQAEKNLGTVGSSLAQGAAGGLILGSMYTGQYGAAVGVISSIPVLSYLSAKSPLKNALINFNKVAEINPAIAKYLAAHINSQLIKAGVVVNQSESGEIQLEKKS